MIDEKKLIEILTKWEYDALPIERDLIEAIIYIVEDQPKVGEWIPCSERMPEKEAKDPKKDEKGGAPAQDLRWSPSFSAAKRNRPPFLALSKTCPGKKGGKERQERKLLILHTFLISF